MDERIILFLLHSLTSQPKIRTNTYVLLLHSDHILTSSVRIRNSVCTCLNGFKSRFGVVSFSPREFSLVSGVTCSAPALLWKLCWLASLSRDVTGKALLRNRWIRGSVTALAQP